MDPSLAAAYREADRLRQERVNEQAWLQGYYVYQALGSVAPMLHAFAKNGTKAKPYPKPLDLQHPEVKNRPPSAGDMRKMENGKSAMRAFMAGINKKFEQKGVGENGERGCSGTSDPG